jgi:23S rRNA (uracil1939-C5)-methyltransferase
VATTARVPQTDALCAALVQAVPQIRSVVLNVNPDDTNVILGKKCVPLMGDGYLEDVLCGLRFRLSALSFYQVNALQAERLYEKAAEYAAPDGATVLDLYCGAGTIGLSMARRAKTVIGVEIVPEAITDAKENARRNGIENARFLCADATQAAKQLLAAGVTPDVIVVDPPRKGCAPELLQSLFRFAPERIVYISCDSATLARDVDVLQQGGYAVQAVTPFDMFPRTGHVETVALMSRVIGQ